MPMIGGDLGAMTMLARRFASAGDEFHARTDQLTQQVAAALTEFTDEMAVLDREARQLAEQIDQEMATLRAQAESTTWTGQHRSQQDQVVVALEADIRGVRTAIETFVTESTGIVRGALTTTMNDMQTNARTAGTNARSVAEAFGQGVEQQRAAFDLVMNG